MNTTKVLYLKKKIMILAAILILVILVETSILLTKTWQNPSTSSTTSPVPNSYSSTISVASTKTVTDSQISPDTIPAGTIVFSDTVQYPERHHEFYIMNGDGTILAPVGFGYYSGSSAWSPDGTKLAVGCENINQICIVDMQVTNNIRTFPLERTFYFQTIEKIDLPTECIENIIPDWGIPSISWSRDGKELAVVCNNDSGLLQTGKVCIIGLDGSSECWSDELGVLVRKLQYSPVEDTMVIDTGGEILITSVDGKKIKKLVNGYNPAWSPDGMNIAFSAYVDGGPRNGIALINKNTGETKWLYTQPTTGEFEEFLCAVCQEQGGRNGGRISWSPDGQYIIFSAMYLGDNSNNIFRLRISDGEMTILANGQFFYNIVGDPNWGTIEYY